jgi:ribosomal protein L11 methyltransferase
VAVVVTAERAEEARGLLLELAPDGFEERDSGPDVELVAYVDPELEARLRAVFPGATSEPVAPGWEDAWRAFHRPVVAGGVWIGPPWERPPPGIPTVVIDPGRAFGTGAHPTTRLCVELLSSLERGSLVDVGCGSGVLAIAAARLGFGPLVALDADPVAVEVTRANAAANGVALEAHLVDATTGAMPVVDVAVANIALEAVAAVLPRLAVRDVVASGYLAEELPVASDWEHLKSLELDGWRADHFRRAHALRPR